MVGLFSLRVSTETKAMSLHSGTLQALVSGTENRYLPVV